MFGWTRTAPGQGLGHGLGQGASAGGLSSSYGDVNTTGGYQIGQDDGVYFHSDQADIPLLPPSSSSGSSSSSSVGRDCMHGGEVVVSIPSPSSSTMIGSIGSTSGGMDEIDTNISTSPHNNNKNRNNIINASMSRSRSSSSVRMSDMDDVTPTLPHPHLAAQLSIGAARPSEKLAWHPLETFRR